MTPQVWITGTGMTRFGVHNGDSTADLVREAVSEALADAGTALEDVDAVFYGSAAQGALEGQLMIAGQIALRKMGLTRSPVFNVENACATGATALNLAIAQVRSGGADVVVAVGAERMNVGARADVLRIFDGAVDVSEPRSPAPAAEHSLFMDIYAAMARDHMAKFGTSRHQLAAVASKNHGHAVHNPLARYRTAMSVEEVLAARPVTYPLTVPMCAPITDGAAAVVVCGPRAAHRHGRAVRVLASVAGSGTDRDLADYDQHITRLLATRAYEQAGVGPGDVSVAEVHDATSFAEVLQTEMLGLCEVGDGGPAAERGETSLGGRIPVNPSGGLVSKGHPLGATGLAQIHELVAQLRGTAGRRQVPGARVAIAENAGGFHAGEEAVAVITVLGG
ncbi:MAG TPA: thiolase family protein [Actinophytocola sp.]|jgi:acetyl-CoA acetyltransferase|uniref:thiolase family protein n=1 Tax=Actinophytocola sp. TaxID=1872138 RepID=UPI002F92CE9A